MADDFVFDFGMRLKDLRKKRNLSQKEVASKLGCHTNTIRHYEDNTQTPPLENLVKLAVMYNSSVDYILGLSDRSNLYIDDLSPNQQSFILNMVKQVRDTFSNT